MAKHPVLLRLVTVDSNGCFKCVQCTKLGIESTIRADQCSKIWRHGCLVRHRPTRTKRRLQSHSDGATVGNTAAAEADSALTLSEISAQNVDPDALVFGALLADAGSRSCNRLFDAKLATRFGVTAAQAVRMFEDETRSALEKKVREEPLVALSFDAGRWPGNKRSLLFFVLHAPNGHWVLPPKAVLSTAAADMVVPLLETKEQWQLTERLRHYVVDGATSNDVVTKSEHALAEAITELACELSVRASLQDESAPLRTLASDDGTCDEDAATVTLEVSRVIATWSQHAPMPLRCLGHYVKNRIDEVHRKHLKSWKCYAFLIALKNSLHGDMNDRRTKLTSHVHKIADAEKTDAINAIEHATRTLSRYTQPTSATYEAVMAIVARLLKSVGTDAVKTVIRNSFGLQEEDAALPAAALSDAPKPPEPTPMDLAQNARDTIKELNVLRKHVSSLSTAAHTATLSDTRWHNSTYGAFLFAHEHWTRIQTFYEGLNSASAPPSVKDLLQIFQNAGASKEIRQQLANYVTTMAPAALFMSHISEVSSSLRGLRAYTLFAGMTRALQRHDETSPGGLLANIIKRDLEAASEGRGPWKAMKPAAASDALTTLRFRFAVELLLPGDTGLETYPAWEELVGAQDAFPTAADFRRWTGLHETDVPKKDWDEWHRMKLSLYDETDQKAVDFWSSTEAQVKMPGLAKAARYLLCVPSVVTACDAAMSACGAIWNERSNAMVEGSIGTAVASRLNKNMLGFFPSSGQGFAAGR